MDPTVVTAIISGIAAVIGAIFVAIPNHMANKSRDAVESYRLEQLEKSINDLGKKFEKHDEIKQDIVKLDARVSTTEREIKELKQLY